MNMNRAKVLIVEDERLAADALQKLVQRDREVELAGTARDGATAVSLIRRLKPDIVFLDVQIPELDGFGVIREIGVDNMPVVVFVTAYDRDTRQAFEVHAVDCLLRPFEANRFCAAARWARTDMHVSRRASRRES